MTNAPASKLSPFGTNCSNGNSSSEPYIAAHNILLAHASAANLYKNKYQVISHKMFIAVGVEIFSLFMDLAFIILALNLTINCRNDGRNLYYI